MNVQEAIYPRGKEESQSQRFDRIYCALRDRICLLAYRPGTILSEVALAEEFGISRTPIKRVFNKLEFMGLVQIKNGVGTIVTDIDLLTFKETYDLRKRLAAMMGELSPVEITSSHLERIDRILADTEDLKTDRGNFDALAIVANDLQQLLLDLTGNTPLREVTELLYYRVARIWYTFLPQFGWDIVYEGQLNEVRDIRAAMAVNDIRSVGQVRSVDLQRMMTLLGRTMVDA